MVRGNAAAKDFLKLLPIAVDGVQLFENVVRLGAHVGARPRRQCLLLERRAAPIPIELVMIADVPERGAAAGQLLVESAHSFRQPISQTFFANVARITRPRTISAQSFVKEQFAPQRNLLRRQLIVSRNFHRRVSTQLSRKRLNVRLELGFPGSESRATCNHSNQREKKCDDDQIAEMLSFFFHQSFGRWSSTMIKERWTAALASV